MKSGNRLLGSGMDVTTVKLMDNPGYNATTVEADPPCQNVQVENMTVNANGSTSTNNYAHGVYLAGENCIVRRVKVINTIGSGALQRESFGIFVTGGLISECEVSSTLGDYTTAIACGNDGAVIEKCRVFLQMWSPTNSPIAYNIGGSNVRLINNYSQGGGVAVYQDSSNITNMVVANNVFKNSAWGVGFIMDHLDGLLIDNNVIELAPANTDQNAILVAPRESAKGVTIRGNIIRYADGLTGTNIVRAYAFSAGDGPVTGATVNNNVWDSSFAGYNHLASNVVVFNNHDLAGNLIADGIQVEPANSIQRRTVAANATLLPQDKFIGVRATATLTLPSAAGRPGKEIIVNGEHSSASITVNRAGSETINGALNSTNLQWFFVSPVHF